MADVRRQLLLIGVVLRVIASRFEYVVGQTGFLSIDCGASQNYTDSRGINWVTDEGYVSSGFNANVTAMNNSGVEYDTLRYFPEPRNKHCYSLPTTTGNLYSVRVWLLYGGGYSEDTIYPNFQLIINSAIWGNIRITVESANSPMYRELIHVAESTTMFVCLARGSNEQDIPFINSLELRQLNNSMHGDLSSSTYLVVNNRASVGLPSNASSIRYPDDPYDRVWHPDGLNDKPAVSTSKPVSTDVFGGMPPMKVMQTARYGALESPMLITVNTATNYSHQLFLYFAEITDLNATETRKFDVFLNDVAFGSVSLSARSSYIAYDLQTYQSTNTPPALLRISFDAESDSSLGPILNAVQILSIAGPVIGTNDEDVNAFNHFVQSFGMTLSSWTGDPCLPIAIDFVTCVAVGGIQRVTGLTLSNYNLSGTIPYSITGFVSLTTLNLDNNSISGSIPNFLSQLSLLQILSLRNNSFTGNIAVSLGSLDNLKELHLDYNNLTGYIPANLTKLGSNLSFSGNPFLCLSADSCPAPSPVSAKSSSIGVIIGGIVGGVALLLVVFLILLFFIRRSRRRASTQRQTGTGFSQEKSVGLHGRQARVFSLAEVKTATNDFAKEIGAGGFGPVYYGQLPNEQEVAVKVSSGRSGQGRNEFLNEVELLSRVHHKSLVSLIGYFENTNQQILVYEFLPGGTLREQLYGKHIQQVLSWQQRLKLAISAAEGLEYLHMGCRQQIIHRDVKSSNILLTEKGVAKVADFGLSKLSDDSATHISTKVKGTFGYLDPEYYITQQLTNKSDVYSYGVVLVEIMTGRPPINLQPPAPDEMNTVEWMKKMLNSGDIEAVVDPNLRGQYNLESMWKVAQLAMMSTEPKGANRISMAKILVGLQEALDMQSRKP